MPEKELEELDIDYFVRAVNYFENDQSVTFFIRNEEQLAHALDINYGE